MPRRSQPWFWKARNAWYVQVNGKQVKLHENKKEADREYYRLMAADGKLDQRQRERMTVADACEAVLASAQSYRVSTRALYDANLGLIAGKFGERKLDSITEAEVSQWIKTLLRKRDSRPLSDSSKANVWAYAKLMFAWAKDEGYIARSPFSRMKNHWHIAKRSSPMSEHDYELVMGLPRLSPRFKELVEFVWRTGCRPGELVQISARHLDPRKMIVRLLPSEHKTGGRNNLAREIHVPPDLWSRLQDYARVRPKGPLFRKKNGNPWTRPSVTDKWCKLKIRHGLTSCLYQARHRFATAQLDSGTPIARVAKMMGHTSEAIVQTTYYHPDADKMAADVSATSDEEAQRLKRVAEERTKKQDELDATPEGRRRKAGRERARRMRANRKANGASGT